MHPTCLLSLLIALCLTLSLTSCDNRSQPDANFQPLVHLQPDLNLQPIVRDSSLRETSGLIRWKQNFISHNDSGNAPDLFILDKAGKLLTRLTVAADNIDWEDISTQGDHVYIADTGNNRGRRRDLSILVVPFSPENLKQKTLEVATRLPVAYAEQSHFQPAPYQHNFDAEALTWVHDELWLLTKRWLDQKTDLYKIPTTAPNQAANISLASNKPPASLHAQQRLDPKMLVTGADFDAHSNTLILVGYSRGWFNRQAWIWLYPVQNGQVIEHLGRQFKISKTGQFEGISLGDDGFIYVSREGWGTNLFRTEQPLKQLLTPLN